MLLTEANTPDILYNIVKFMPFFTVLLGSGIIVTLFKSIIDWRKNNRSFDIEMNELMRQNKSFREEQILYVQRGSLEKALNDFLESNCKICKISGPAGSGKTRFALNITGRNHLLSKYCFVYIHKSYEEYFKSPVFKNLDSIQGNRRYVFIFDYVYENGNVIKALLNLATKTQKHKYIFVEREYTWWEFNNLFDTRDYSIVMEAHKMNETMLSNVFCNALPPKKRRAKKTKEDSISIAQIITSKIDPLLARPIFAELAADIYDSNSNYNFNDKTSVSQIIESYWKKKINKVRVNEICFNHTFDITEAFITQLEVFLRSLLLTAAVTARRVTVTNRSGIILTINDYNKDIYPTIAKYCDQQFLNKINSMPIESLKELFGVMLKEHVKVNKNKLEDRFEIVSELDIISEWVFADSIKEDSQWIKDLIVFFRVNFKDDYVNFVRRGSLDFPDLVEQLQLLSEREVIVIHEPDIPKIVEIDLLANLYEDYYFIPINSVPMESQIFNIGELVKSRTRDDLMEQLSKNANHTTETGPEVDELINRIDKKIEELELQEQIDKARGL